MKKKYAVLVFILILLVAGYLRFSRADIAPFSGDQGRDLLATKQFIETGLLPPGVMGNDGMVTTFGPLHYLLLSIPLYFSYEVWIVNLFISIFFLVSLILFFIWGKKFFETNTMLIATALYAVNAWSIYYSSYISNTNWLVLFVIIFIFSIMEIVRHNKIIYLISASTAFVFMMQLHLSAIALAPLLLYALVIKWKYIRLKLIVASALIIMVLEAPYLVLLKLQTGAFTPSTLTYAASGYFAEPLRNFMEAIGIPIILATNYYGRYLFGSLYDTIFILKYTPYLELIGGAVFVISIIFIFVKLVNSGKQSSYVIIALSFISPVLFFIIRQKNIAPHYYLILQPIIFLAMGIFLSDMLQKQGKTKVIAVLTIIFILISGIGYSSYATYLIKNQSGTDSTYGALANDKLAAILYAHETSSDGKVLFYKWAKSEYVYLSKTNYIDYGVILQVDELKQVKGKLVMERNSRYAKHLSSAEELYLTQQPKKVFGRVVVFTLDPVNL